MLKLEGTFTALVTPFSDGAIDFESFEKLLSMQKDANVDGLVPCGCTGEAATLTSEERSEIIEKTTAIAGNDTKVVAGTGTNSTSSTIELTRQAEKLHADAAMLITPYYNKPTQEGLFHHFKTVAGSTGIPLVLYNVPSRTGVKLDPFTTKRLFDTGRFIAIKEAGGSVDAVSDLLSLGSINVLSGDDALTVPMISLGAGGVVSVVSNVFPAAVKRMVSAALSGDMHEARTIHYQLIPIVRAAFIETNPAPVKAMLSVLGIIKEELRLPLVPVKENHRMEIKIFVDRFISTWNG